jgi:putative hemolysin
MLMIEIVFVLFLIVVNGVLAMSELAIVSSRRSRLKTLVERGHHGSRRALALASDPGRFLSTVQIGITLVGILAGAFSGATIGVRLAEVMVANGVSRDLAEPAAVAVIVAVITYLSLIVGELVPKQLALRHPEPIACALAPAMTLLASVAHPLVWMLDVSSRAALSLVARRPPPGAHLMEEEIKALVAEAETAGVLEPEERAMIAGVMRLGDRPVRAVMTPRHEVDFIDLTDNPEAIKQRIGGSIHSRLPACEGPPDKVVGIIQAKDVADAFLRGETVEFRRLVRSAPVIPETMDALDVIDILRDSPVHIGLVHDEYGHFEGIVTSTDILEVIAGQFRTEEGPAEPQLVKRGDGSYLAAGSMQADELAEILGISLPEPRSYHTVAGLMLASSGRLPRIGEAVTVHGWRFEVVDLDGRRIDKILISRGLPRRRMAA